MQSQQYLSEINKSGNNRSRPHDNNSWNLVKHPGHQSFGQINSNELAYQQYGVTKALNPNNYEYRSIPQEIASTGNADNAIEKIVNSAFLMKKMS